MNGCQESPMSGDAPIVNPTISTEQKRCSKCGATKQPNAFNLHKRRADGRCGWCRECTKEYGKKWRIANFEKAKECHRQWKSENVERAAKTLQIWRTTHPDKAREYRRRWKIANPEKVREQLRRSRAANPERTKEKNYRANRKRYSTPVGKLNKSIAVGIYRSLIRGSKAGRHWEELVDFTGEQLKRHLEKRFQEGMTWDNYGKWHIDHKNPLTAFNFETPGDVDFRRCWRLKNLQPMWAADNIRKYNKLEKSFQPSLLLQVSI